MIADGPDFVRKYEGVHYQHNELYRKFRPSTIWDKEVVVIRCYGYVAKNSLASKLENICENHTLFSADGLEDRVVAKDLLYKFNEWLKKHKGKSIEIDPEKMKWYTGKAKYKGQNIDRPILKPHTRSWFKEFMESNG